MSNNRNIFVLIFVLLIIGATGFFIYTTYFQTKPTTTASVQGVREENKTNSDKEREEREKKEKEEKEKKDKENNPGTV
jgi:cell division protein FtsN